MAATTGHKSNGRNWTLVNSVCRVRSTARACRHWRSVPIPAAFGWSAIRACSPISPATVARTSSAYDDRNQCVSGRRGVHHLIFGLMIRVGRLIRGMRSRQSPSQAVAKAHVCSSRLRLRLCLWLYLRLRLRERLLEHLRHHSADQRSRDDRIHNPVEATRNNQGQRRQCNHE